MEKKKLGCVVVMFRRLCKRGFGSYKLFSYSYLSLVFHPLNGGFQLPKKQNKFSNKKKKKKLPLSPPFPYTNHFLQHESGSLDET